MAWPTPWLRTETPMIPVISSIEVKFDTIYFEVRVAYKGSFSRERVWHREVTCKPAKHNVTNNETLTKTRAEQEYIAIQWQEALTKQVEEGDSNQTLTAQRG